MAADQREIDLHGTTVTEAVAIVRDILMEEGSTAGESFISSPSLACPII
jgi:hypothetical protein